MSDTHQPAATPEPARWTAPGWALVAAAFAVGFVNYPLRVVGFRLDHVPGDGIDNQLNNFVLEHGYRYLTGKADSFWDAPSFYPVRGSTAWSDAHLGMLPVYAAVRAAGAAPERAFQWHFLIACALNFAAAAWAARRLGFGPAGAAAAAYVFAFGLPVVAQTQHTQLVPRFLVPVAVVLGAEFLRRPMAWRLAAVAACVAGQIYLTVYMGFFLALLLAGGGVVALARFPHRVAWRELAWPGWRGWVARVAAVTVAALAADALLKKHTRGVGDGTTAEVIKAGAPVPASWLSPIRPAYWHPESGWSPLPALRVPPGEHIMFPGLMPVVAVLTVAALAVRPTAANTPREAAVLASLTALFLAALVTRVGDFWPYEFVTGLTGAGGIRVPGRVVMVLLFPAGLALAWLVDAAVRAVKSERLAAGVAVLALALVAVDQRLIPLEGHDREWTYLRTPLDLTLARKDRIVEAVRRNGVGRYFYVFPSVGADGRFAHLGFGTLGLQVEAMRAAQDLGVPCVNGWTGYVPPGWSGFTNYRELNTWLCGACGLPPEELHGLVVVGEPGPPHPGDDAFEAFMRGTFPPRPVFAASP